MVAEESVGALRIDRLAEALGVSKGSFYHHFGGGMRGYQQELLAHYERQHTYRFIDVVESADQTPTEKLQLLRRMVIDDESEQPRLEVNIRSWAAQDSEVRRVLERVDATRIEYLRSLWRDVSGDAEEAVLMGRLLYVVLIGAHHVLPQLDTKSIDDLYGFVLAPALRRQQ
ncbi:TetR/AcrR family transcriptional regulator [Georgenia halophila]|uniref:TetR/AcrR family transcriptional regulator n=1 Tax=Georgenia halophila TaxID=620889 RepID=A0ABP8LG88_9MICO